MVNMPECQKLVAIQEQSQIVGEFLEWLGDIKHYSITEERTFMETFEHMDETPYEAEVTRIAPIRESREHLLAEFFGIALDKVEQEKRALLEELRNK